MSAGYSRIHRSSIWTHATLIVFIVFIVAINFFGSIMWGPISFMGDAVLGFWSLIF